ncbi:hypothetical protein EV132_12661 [Rhizobium sullae]|uniref:Uncharacterized protein n=1 Tax=Rhizobium sullae TaxID=50338 RepID=A0A4V2V805_RHISU|nr:hypothetical protein EV132_12661 [Rhizobium sullae]
MEPAVAVDVQLTHQRIVLTCPVRSREPHRHGIKRRERNNPIFKLRVCAQHIGLDENNRGDWRQSTGNRF